MLKVLTNFGVGKEQLHARYRAGTELALEQADLLKSEDETALQAIVIYLTVLQSLEETDQVWFLNGMLIRLAVSMNLHCDSSHLDILSSLKVEMQRRQWWQICLIDSRSTTCKDSRYKLTSRDFDTLIPTNIDDTALESLTRTTTLDTDKWTSTTPFLIRCEIWKLSQQLQSLHNQPNPISLLVLHESLTLLQQSRTKLQETYLKHLNPTNHLHTFTSTSTALFFAKLDLILHSSPILSQPPHPTPMSPQDIPFHASLSIITHTHTLQHSPEWAPYRWQLSNHYKPPWHALRIVLTRLCAARAWTSICEEAWFSAARKSIDACSELDVRHDVRYRDLLSLVDAVEKRRAGIHRLQASSSFSGEGDEQALDRTSAAPIASSPPHLDLDENGRGSAGGNLDGLLRDAIRDSATEDPTLSVNYYAWNENYDEEYDSSFAWWHVNGF